MTTTAITFFDAILARTGAKNDRKLAAVIGIDPCSISNMRAGRITMGPTTLLRIHETTDISIAELKALAGWAAYQRG